MIKKINKKSGFTLIETIIYVALFGIIFSGAIVGIYNLTESANKNDVFLKIEMEGMFINQKISQAISNATNAQVSNLGKTITLEVLDTNQNPIVISETGNSITLSRGGNPALELNNERYKINDLDFDYKIDDKDFEYKTYLRN